MDHEYERGVEDCLRLVRAEIEQLREKARSADDARDDFMAGRYACSAADMARLLDRLVELAR